MVVGEARAVIELDLLFLRVDVLDLAEKHRGIALAGEDVADRRGDRRRRKPGGRDLAEQRRKEMVVRAIHHDDFGRCLAQRLRGPQASKAAAEDHYARTHGDVVIS